MASYNVHAGHCPYKKGAYGAVGILNESVEDRKVKDLVIAKLKALGHTVHDCTCETNETQSGCLSKIVAKCNAHDAALDVSIHLNSGRNDSKGDGKTGGVEVWCYNSKTASVATSICNAVKALGFSNRGVKYSTDLYVLRKTKSPAILIECAFVDDADDAKLWNAEKMATAIVKGITGNTVGDTTTASPTSAYYPKYTGSSVSIVSALQELKIDSNFSNRKKIAAANGIKEYSGSATQNTSMLILLKKGKLKKY